MGRIVCGCIILMLGCSVDRNPIASQNHPSHAPSEFCCFDADGNIESSEWVDVEWITFNKQVIQ